MENIITNYYMPILFEENRLGLVWFAGFIWLHWVHQSHWNLIFVGDKDKNTHTHIYSREKMKRMKENLIDHIIICIHCVTYWYLYPNTYIK